LIVEGETPLAAAKREFAEETGHRPRAKSLPLGEARQLGGKIVHVWAVEDDWEPTPSEQYVRDGMAATIRTAADLF
jgi:predicted NUDIX family NTP pyrophosphohydrolase